MDTRSLKLLAYLRIGRVVALAGFCLNFTYAIAYSHICFGAALALYLAEWILRGSLDISPEEKRTYQLFGLFVALCAVSSVVNDTPLESLASLREEWLFLIVPVTVTTMRDSHHRNWILGATALSTAVIGFYGWLQRWFGFNLRPGLPLDFGPDGYNRASGAFHNTLTYGNLFAMLSVFFLALSVFERNTKWRIVFAITGALALGATVYSYGRGPMLGAAVGIVALGVVSFRRMWKPALAGALAVVALIAISSPGIVGRFITGYSLETEHYHTAREKSSSRMTIWRTTTRIIGDNPVFGVGSGNFREAYERYGDTDLVRFFTHAHNDLLNISAYAGLPATLGYLFFWTFLLKIFWARGKTGLRVTDSATTANGHALALAAFFASTTFFVCGLTEAVFADEEVRSGLMLVWGFGLGGLRVAANANSGNILTGESPEVG